jgi:hypothetical protein
MALYPMRQAQSYALMWQPQCYKCISIPIDTKLENVHMCTHLSNIIVLTRNKFHHDFLSFCLWCDKCLRRDSVFIPTGSVAVLWWLWPWLPHVLPGPTTLFTSRGLLELSSLPRGVPQEVREDGVRFLPHYHTTTTCSSSRHRPQCIDWW